MPSLIVVMGVCGSGKSMVGLHLAEYLDIDFVDGDDLHPPDNVERMRNGIQLNDETRKPWLAEICRCAEDFFTKNESVVIACSALKRKYRDQIRSISQPVHFVFLNGPKSTIQQRLDDRVGHYMPASMLASQLEDLELPKHEPDVFEIDISPPANEVLQAAIGSLSEFII